MGSVRYAPGMKRSHRPVFLLVTLLSCSSVSSAVPPVSPQAAARTDDGGQATIRFGDPLEHLYTAPFFPSASYDAAITTPDALLGQLHGSRLSHHAEILACFRRWATESERLTLSTYATTHEGRELVYAVVTSPANHARLDTIRANLARLHDPRGLSEAETTELAANTPPVAWMGYSIHGDELSGSDGGLALGYHLVASTDAAVTELLERVVVVIDPVMNPDGRERIVSMVEQSAGYAKNLDYASMHRGRWPYGRGNHYLFDMNRDWMAGTQPETRGRWQAVLSFHPQLFVDAHEMGSLDTFLIYPQAEPLNTNLAERHTYWQRAYAEGAGASFDRYGWTYYTREWADGWAPFYSDAWGSLIGATGILYEQARTLGSSLMRASGNVLTYREAVHHQAAASLANLTTLSARRDEVLTDYVANQRKNVAAETPGNDRVFVVRPRPGSDREDELVRILTGQNVEVFRTRADFEATNANGALGQVEASLRVPAGSLIVPARQPQRQIVRAFLEFDPRMDKKALDLERRDLERKGETRIYDLTSWSLPHALDLDAWWCDAVDVERDAVTAAASDEPRFTADASSAVAWAIHGTADASVAFAAHAMEAGLAVHLSDEPFRVGEVELPTGSLLVRRNENTGTAAELAARVESAARRAGVDVVHVVGTSLAPDEGPDLGGGHFALLARPRVALVSNAPIAPDTYGHLWYLLDHELGLPFTILDAQVLGDYDLRRYNVLILPATWGGVAGLLEPLKETLATWVNGGGTLIACGDSAAALTREGLGLSSVVLRRDALEELEDFHIPTQREWDALAIDVAPELVWEPAPPPAQEGEDDGEDDDEDTEPDFEVRPEDDAWMRTFSPYGVTLRGIVQPHAWVTAGASDELPVYVSGSEVFLAKKPVRAAVRLAPAERLRLGGLVWPEARERLAESAWLTVERIGNGQIVLFASMPGFRGYQRATGRLFANAVVYGPGAGASQPTGW